MNFVSGALLFLFFLITVSSLNYHLKAFLDLLMKELMALDSIAQTPFLIQGHSRNLVRCRHRICIETSVQNLFILTDMKKV